LKQEKHTKQRSSSRQPPLQKSCTKEVIHLIQQKEQSRQRIKLRAQAAKEWMKAWQQQGLNSQPGANEQ